MMSMTAFAAYAGAVAIGVVCGAIAANRGQWLFAALQFTAAVGIVFGVLTA